jgi:anti-sigma factor RsiW
MDRNKHSKAPLECRECLDGLQEYMDGTLEKTRSLRFFLHLRDCDDCRAEHDRMQALYGLLENLPQHEVPADFDDKILASVPYESYRAMEPIRRERVPVYFEEEFLPAFVRSPMTRMVGGLVAVGGVVAGQAVGGMETVSLFSLLGLLPELLVRLQGLGRWAVLAADRSKS